MASYCSQCFRIWILLLKPSEHFSSVRKTWMFENHGRFVQVCCLLLPGLVLVRPDATQAQGLSQLSEKPIAIFYASDLSEKRVLTYVKNLTERMNFAESIRSELASEIEERIGTESEVQNPVDGYAVYLVSGAIPSIEIVSFCNVTDSAHAKRLLEIKSKNIDGNSIKDMGNECFVVERETKEAIPLPDGADEAKFTTKEGRVAQSVNGVTQSSYEFTRTIEEKDARNSLWRAPRVDHSIACMISSCMRANLKICSR